MAAARAIEVLPATAERWPDVVRVMEDSSYARKCWCAYWILPNREFRAGWGEANRRALQQPVAEGREPGVIAYVDGAPAGWCGVAPRSFYDRLTRSRSFAALDDLPVWSITCFVVAKAHRRQGLMRRLIRGAVGHAARHGAGWVEAYPIEPRAGAGSSELYMGTLGAFLAEGFVEVARRLPARPMVRRPCGSG